MAAPFDSLRIQSKKLEPPSLNEILKEEEEFNELLIKSQADLDFAKLTTKDRVFIYLNLITINFLYACWLGVYTVNFPAIAKKNGIDQQRVSFLMSCFGLGLLLSAILYKKVLRIFKRRTLWIIINLSSMLSLLGFGMLLYFTNNSSWWSFYFAICLFGIGSSRGLGGSYINSTTVVLFPNKIGFLMSILIFIVAFGVIAGPQFQNIFQNSLSISGCCFLFIFLIALSTICSSFVIPNSEVQVKQKGGQSPIKILLFNYRNCSTYLTFLFTIVILRMQNSGVTIDLIQRFSFDKDQIAYTNSFMGIGGLLGTVGMIPFFFLFDCRLIFLGFGMILPAIGAFMASPPFLETSGFAVVLGYFFMKMINVGSACAAQDIMKVYNSSQKGEINVSTKDIVGNSLALGQGFGWVLGPIIEGVAQQFLDFDGEIMVSGVCLLAFGVNFVFSSEYFKEKIEEFRKKTRGKEMGMDNPEEESSKGDQSDDIFKEISMDEPLL